MMRCFINGRYIERVVPQRRLRRAVLCPVPVKIVATDIAADIIFAVLRKK